MKNSLIIFCFFFLTCSQIRDTIKVEYPLSSGVELLSSSVFDGIEIVKLYEKMLPFGSRLVVKDESYYIAGDDEVHLFDTTGKHIANVGIKGRGPAEYTSIDGMIIEDNGDISIYSRVGTLYTYSRQGRFLGSNEYQVSSREFARINGFNYHFLGNGKGRPYQLYISDNQNYIIDSCLAAINATSFILGSVFSEYGNALILCPSDDGNIYRLTDGEVHLSYKFNFGMYHIPDEYYRCRNVDETFNLVLSTTIAFKCMFLENQKYAFLETCVFDGKQESERMLYGILEKATSTWKWYYMNEGDFLNSYNLKYLDNSYLYFIVYPDLMKDDSIAERFPELGVLDEECTMVILKCKLG